ncbi:hypothetical protein EYM_06020 [Ignicoccus islandicus DSM 13165]|uniref:Uncharacterized protein n=2 Tax=Ignicoccus islandicus TaxID=54259 RepID=A0A0U2U9A8_9CREN|nr:hypothetical protein EYM_06020 [Ignicoccus islandicus DSM 13165]
MGKPEFSLKVLDKYVHKYPPYSRLGLFLFMIVVIMPTLTWHDVVHSEHVPYLYRYLYQLCVTVLEAVVVAFNLIYFTHLFPRAQGSNEVILEYAVAWVITLALGLISANAAEPQGDLITFLENMIPQISLFTLFYFNVIYALELFYFASNPSSKLHSDGRDYFIWPYSIPLMLECPFKWKYFTKSPDCILKYLWMFLPLLVSLLFLVIYPLALDETRSSSDVIDYIFPIKIFSVSSLVASSLDLMRRLFHAESMPCVKLDNVFGRTLRFHHLLRSNRIIILGFGVFSRVLTHVILIEQAFGKFLEVMPDYFYGVKRPPVHSERLEATSGSSEINVPSNESVELEENGSREGYLCSISDYPVVTSITIVDRDPQKHLWCTEEGLKRDMKYCLTVIDPKDTLVLSPSLESALILRDKFYFIPVQKYGKSIELRTPSLVLSLQGDATDRFLLYAMNPPESVYFIMVPSGEDNLEISSNISRITEVLMSEEGTQHAFGIYVRRGEPSKEGSVRTCKLVGISRTLERVPNKYYEATSPEGGSDCIVYSNFEHRLAHSIGALADFYSDWDEEWEE